MKAQNTKMKLVRENIEFKRGLDPKASLGIGIKSLNNDLSKLGFNISKDFPFLKFEKYYNLNSEDKKGHMLFSYSMDQDYFVERLKKWIEKNTNFIADIDYDPRIDGNQVRIDLFRKEEKVFENIEFKRGIKPKESLGLGYAGQIQDIWKRAYELPGNKDQAIKFLAPALSSMSNKMGLDQKRFNWGGFGDTTSPYQNKEDLGYIEIKSEKKPKNFNKSSWLDLIIKKNGDIYAAKQTMGSVIDPNDDSNYYKRLGNIETESIVVMENIDKELNVLRSLRENLNFKRRQDPKSSLGLGEDAKWKKKFNDHMDRVGNQLVAHPGVIKMLKQLVVKSRKLHKHLVDDFIGWSGGTSGSWDKDDKMSRTTSAVNFGHRQSAYGMGDHIYIELLENGVMHGQRPKYAGGARELLGSWNESPLELANKTAEFLNKSYELSKERKSKRKTNESFEFKRGIEPKDALGIRNIYLPPYNFDAMPDGLYKMFTSLSKGGKAYKIVKLYTSDDVKSIREKSEWELSDVKKPERIKYYLFGKAIDYGNFEKMERIRGEIQWRK